MAPGAAADEQEPAAHHHHHHHHHGSSSSRHRAWIITACSIAAYAYSFFVFGLQVSLLGPTASVLAHRAGVQEADLGIVFLLNGLSSIIGALPSGWLTDRMPGHMVLAAALALEAAGFMFIPLCTSLVTLCAAFATVALSWNIINTAGNTYVLWAAADAAAARATAAAAEAAVAAATRGGSTSDSDGEGDGDGDGDASSSSSDALSSSDDAKSSGVLINLVNALFGLGSLGAPLLAESSASLLGTPLAAYYLTAALTALSCGSFLLLPSPRPPAAGAGSDAGPLGGSGGGGEPRAASDGLRQPLLQAAVPAAGEHSAPDDAGAGAAAAAPSLAASGSSWWSGGALTWLLLIIAAFNFLNVGTEVGFGGWVFTYCTKLGMSDHQAHAVNAAYWGSFTLGRIVASFAALACSPAALLFASLPLAVAGAVAALLAPARLLASGPFLLAVTSLIGVGASAGFANSLALLDAFTPGGVTGGVTGLLGGVAGAGCMSVPLAVALLAKHTALGYNALMWLVAASFAAQLALVPAALLAGSRVQRGAGGACAKGAGERPASCRASHDGLHQRLPAAAPEPC